MSVTTGTVRALLADGQQVQLRPATPADEPALARLSADHSLSLRFFAVDHADAQDVLPRVLPDDPLFGFALLALLGDDIVGLAAYQTMDTPHSAETALLVSDMTESLGIGALLLEHLVSHARRHGVEILHAEVLVENSQALQVFADMGLTPRTRRAGSALLMDIPLRYDERYLDALAQREIEADVASLTPLLAPTSVAVVGASRTGRGVGHALLTHLLESGFQGPVFPVHPQAETLAGLPAFPSIGALPETPELVVLAVPADRVADIAEQCGRRGVRGLLVVSAGLGTGPEGRRLLEVVRRYGMRLIGPSGAGIANTDPMVALDAHVAHGRARPGDIGVVAQAGGIGIALLEALSHIGLGISTFVSTGERFDVSSNDMLRWWGSDEGTKVACIYVESFGNPRKFARLARRLAHRIPIVAVRSVDVTAQPAVARDALFEQAGIIATDDLRETIDVLTFLDTQPLPAGPRVAIVSNAGGGAALAASAGERYDLRLATLTRQDTLTVLMPGHAHAVNPVDTTVDIEPDVFGRVVRAVADDPNVDAVLVVLAPLAWDGLDEAVEDAAGAVAVPLAVARLGQAVAVTVRPAARGRRVPVYSDPAAALRALGHAQRYARWREQIPGSVPETSDVDKETASAAIERFLAEQSGGGWLDWSTLYTVAKAYGLSLPATAIVSDERAAGAALSTVDAPVAMKALVPEVVHRSDEHAVVLDLGDERQVRETYRRMARRYGDRLQGVLVQQMVPAGLEVLIGVVQDPTFGPLVQVAAGGVATEWAHDRVTRLLPLTDHDVADMLQSLQIAPVLAGFRGSPPLDSAALTGMIHRVARLVQDLPAITEMNVNPAIVQSTGCVAVDIKMRVEQVEATDPYLRRLR